MVINQFDVPSMLCLRSEIQCASSPVQLLTNNLSQSRNFLQVLSTATFFRVDRSPFDQGSIAAAVMLVLWVFPVLTCLTSKRMPARIAWKNCCRTPPVLIFCDRGTIFPQPRQVRNLQPVSSSSNLIVKILTNKSELERLQDGTIHSFPMRVGSIFSGCTVSEQNAQSWQIHVACNRALPVSMSQRRRSRRSPL